jgi:large subunit ribosomal protein L24
MKVKVGDNVKVLAGKDKGKKVVVEGINIVKKHVKPNRMNEVGSIVEVEAPIHVSNVKVVDEKATKKAEPKKATATKTAKKSKKTEEKAS